MYISENMIWAFQFFALYIDYRFNSRIMEDHFSFVSSVHFACFTKNSQVILFMLPFS